MNMSKLETDFLKKDRNVFVLKAIKITTVGLLALTADFDIFCPGGNTLISLKQKQLYISILYFIFTTILTRSQEMGDNDTG